MACSVEIAEKKKQVVTWIKKFRNCNSKVIVNDFGYCCHFSGRDLCKTIIVIPSEVLRKGVITINKPLLEVELIDIIGLCKKLRCKDIEKE